MKQILLSIICLAVFVGCERQTQQSKFDPDCEVGGIKFEFVEIPEGYFMMGSPESEAERKPEEIQHKVTLSGFYMAKYEVTQEQWKAIMGADNNPSLFKGDKLPVEMVSYNDVLKFIDKLNELTQKEYRLPTEAEWEYACRAGTTTPFFTGDNITTDQANYDGTEPYMGTQTGVFREKTVPVGSFQPNMWGLYDMHGNVWEWCSDWYDKDYYKNSPATNPLGPDNGSSRIVRGGSWDEYAKQIRSANRSAENPELSFISLGFRLVHSKKII